MASPQKVVFISGANRGIGHAMALKMAQRGYQVVAGYRNERRSRELLERVQGNDKLTAFRVDVTAQSDLKQLFDFISDRFGYLDILVNNAGVNIAKSEGLNDLEWEDFAETLKVNLGGPFLVTKYLYPLLMRGKEKKIVNISSIMSSIQLSEGDMTPYRVSKTAVNMLTKNQSIAYKADGVTVVCLHPGWVRTDMGGPSASMTVEESVGKLIPIIEGVTLANSGEFISVEGGIIPY